jgi:CO/xanthine dehydrogenase FAD-binding subunit
VTATAASYLTATSIEEAVAAMAAGARPIAGGTDLVVGARHGKAPLPEALVGVHRIPGLSAITEPADGGLSVGALVTHASIVTHPGVLARFTGLADASAIVGSHSTRANGTLGGNVMNASPAMDTGAPLLCHGAVAVLHGPGGVRRVDLDALWTAPGRVAARPDELLVAVELPAPPAGTGSAYVRLQYRRQMEIAIVGAGAVVTVAGGVVTGARIAIAALAPVIHRVPEAEAALGGVQVGTEAGPGSAEAALVAAGRLAAEASRPISDVRGSADYRRAMAAVITRRAIVAALARAAGGGVAVPASDSTYGS